MKTRMKKTTNRKAALPVVVDSCVWFPVEESPSGDFFTVRNMSISGEVQTVVALRKDRPGYVGVPRVAGLKLISKYEDRRTSGQKVTYPKQANLRDYQVPFVEHILHTAETYSDFCVEAATGKGKTVCGLAVAARLGVACMVVVDQERLLLQWIDRAKEHLGLTDDQIGIVQGDTCDYEGKALVIGMVQTLTRREYEPSFYERFGVVLFDESHSAGAPTFSRVLMQFPAKLRLGLSATPDRKDAFGKLLSWNLGPVRAFLTSELPPSMVYVRENHTVYSYGANISKMTGTFVNEVAEDGDRNLLIAEAAKWLYDIGRDVLVISDRVEQLQVLKSMCATAGIPEFEMGIFARCRAVYAYEKDPKPPLKLPVDAGVQYSPVRLSVVQKKIPKAELDRVQQSARILFATYGFMAKGVDIPRLSAGIDATPRSEATQVHGRILRAVPGKPTPIWVTVRDINSYRSEYQLLQRIQDYLDGNAEVFLWRPEKGRKRLDPVKAIRDLRESVMYLRDRRIEKAIDGNYVLL